MKNRRRLGLATRAAAQSRMRRIKRERRESLPIALDILLKRKEAFVLAACVVAMEREHGLPDDMLEDAKSAVNSVMKAFGFAYCEKHGCLSDLATRGCVHEDQK